MGHMYSKNKQLKREYLNELHKKVPDMDLKEVIQIYKNFQKHSNGKGNLTRKDFERVYKDAFGKKAKKLAGLIFNAFDVDGSNTVDFEEFLIGLSITETSTDRTTRIKKIQWAFDVYDKDRSGTIDRHEMHAIVNAVAELSPLPDDLTRGRTAAEYANELFDAVDSNGDGEITFEEFKIATEKHETLLDLLLPAPPSACSSL